MELKSDVIGHVSGDYVSKCNKHIIIDHFHLGVSPSWPPEASLRGWGLRVRLLPEAVLHAQQAEGARQGAHGRGTPLMQRLRKDIQASQVSDQQACNKAAQYFVN